MLIISFDALGDRELEVLAKYPAISKFINSATLYRDVSSVFVSNTYPAHTSIATGVNPNIHGIYANFESFPSRDLIWSEDERKIRAKTLWQAAAEKGIETAAVLWPVTGFSETIRYNIPEIHKRQGQSQIAASLKFGSKLLQIKMFLKYGKLLDGTNQPNLDDFSTACMVDILKKQKPGLALIHLTAYDSLCHKYGRDSEELDIAYKSLDNNLARLLEAVDDDRDVIIFSDHAQINVHTSISPNKMLSEMGLLHWNGDMFLPGDSGCHFACCGGSAFFHAGSLLSESVDEVRNKVEQSEGFRRFLTDEEMRLSGQPAAFGFCPIAGYSYEGFSPGHKATHGYPLDMPDYTVFYMARGDGFTPGKVVTGGSILDITKIVSQRLELNMQ